MKWKNVTGQNPLMRTGPLCPDEEWELRGEHLRVTIRRLHGVWYVGVDSTVLGGSLIETTLENAKREALTSMESQIDLLRDDIVRMVNAINETP